MSDSETKYPKTHVHCKRCQFNEASNPCSIQNVSIIVHKKKSKRRKKYKMFKYTPQPTLACRRSSSSVFTNPSPIKRLSSMPDMNVTKERARSHTRSSHTAKNQSKSPFKTHFIVNLVSEHRFDKCLDPFNYPGQKNMELYKCQVNSPDEVCCCCCNSDAMFEVMRSLYECYKKKNCVNCNCILCGHLPRHEKHIGEMKKSSEDVGLETTSAKERKEKIRQAEKALDGKTPAEKETILREMAKTRQPLPEGKTSSEKVIIKKIRIELGLPPEPKTADDKKKMRKAEAAGIITPLEGKTPEQKENILKAQAALGITLPEGRTSSEKSLIRNVQASAGIPIGIPSEKLKKARAAGLITPLEGKTPERKEKILKGLAMHGLPLPEGITPSLKKLIDKIRFDLGLPPEPKSKAMRDRYRNAAKAGLLQPLEGKSPREKERILQGLADVGIPLPEGRTPSEKALVNKVKAKAGPPLDIIAPSKKMRKAKAAGLLTPLAGKKQEQREKILIGLAMQGIPLPEGQTPSEKKLITKVRTNLGLPPEPKTKAIRDKHQAAADIGLLLPLEGKTPAQKEKILHGLHDMAIPLPEGRTPSEKLLIDKIKAGPRALSEKMAPSEKMRRAKAAGLLTPLKGKSQALKEKILKGLARFGLPLPEGQTPSEKKLIDKVRADLGLPPEPKTPEMRDKYAKAADAGLLQPLEGKTPAQKEKVLSDLHDMGIPLPEGRTSSEKALIAQVKARPRKPRASLDILTPSEKMRRAKAAGLLTPLAGKTPQHREKILKGLAMQGIPLPEGQTQSEKDIINKVRTDLGLPPEPKTKAMRDKHQAAADIGLLLPLEGKTPAQKENILQGLHDMGIPLPEGRTPSEKVLVAQVKARPRAPLAVIKPSERMRRAKAKGFLTPLKGKPQALKEKILKGLARFGLPLPEGQTPSEKNLINKVRIELGLPPEPKTPEMREKYAKAADAGLLQPLEGKTPAQKEKILLDLHDMGIPLPEGRTPSEKSLIIQIKARPRAPTAMVKPSERMRRAKAEGFLTPLKGKPQALKEKILNGLARFGLPLPEGQTPSEKKLINKVRIDLGLPPEPKTPEMREKYAKAADAGLLQPLEGKTPAQKEKILLDLHDMGIPLPEGRTPSEKSLIIQIKARPRAPTAMVKPSERMRRAKAEGLLTPLKGKPLALKEKILKGLARFGLPLPEGQTPSEKKLIDKVRVDLGLPPEPKNPEMREKYAKAADAGLLQPLEGKTPAQKEKILLDLHDMGIPLPEGRTPSEKSLIIQIKARPRAPTAMVKPSERMRRAKAEGFLTPLKGKPQALKEKILNGLARFGLPLPEGQTPSEKNLINKVRIDLGLPPEPKTPEMREKYAKAADAGLLQPLEGKTPAQKEKILLDLHDMGIPLPEGRTPSEKSLIIQVKARPRAPTAMVKPSERMRRAKAEGFLTPLRGKPQALKEKILKGLARLGLPLPEGQTPSEKQIIDKVRADLGLPPEPKTPEMRDKYAKAADVGFLQPLEGKTPAQKEKILQGLHDMGIPLPEGRTSSEKALIDQVKARPRTPSAVLKPSERMRRAKAEGMLTPLKGKTLPQKEKILKGLAKNGLPLPEGQTPSEKKLINKVRTDLGLPPEPKTPDMRDKYAKAADAGLLQPLEGKTPAQKEKILQGLHDKGIPLPEGRTPSEKALIVQVKAKPRAPSAVLKPSERMRRAKAEGLLTPLKGKTPAQKEKILKGLAKNGLPLPEGQTPSEKKLIDKVRTDLGLPPEPKTLDMRDRYVKAADAGLLKPLEGKTSAQKVKILLNLHDMGIPLPEGRSPSEKSLIAKVKAKPRAPSAELKPSERMRRAKAEGLLTPLKGKTPAQKEKIFKGLAKNGLPLPEGQTPSEKKLIDKVRIDLGLPPEPKTPEMRDKYVKAANAGLMQPLEGKSPKEKEKILQGLADKGIPLPEGRTPSEKALVTKIKARPRVLAPSEKLRRAKAAGLLTPLKGKTAAQKEKVLKGLAKYGLPLPEGQTPSEKKIITKVRADLGLPPEPKTPEMREKYAKAADAGLLQPLEGKTPAQKEKILQGLHDKGIPLPEGRTPSEKALIVQVKAKPRAPSAVLKPSERMRRAKAEGLLTPLKGKPQALKEKILKGLARFGLPLPEGQTPSEKKIIDKVRADLGLPPEPETPEMRDKYAKAANAGLMQPLEGKSPKEKEIILQGLADMGIPLPEGRTPSEKALISKVKARPRGLAPSEKLRKAKAAGLLTPLEGKSPAQKEKILKGLAMHSIPLPEGKTPSEKQLIDNVRAELGLPPEPKTPSVKEKYAKAQAAGLITPLEGKSPSQKEKILKRLAAMRLPLPKGRTPSEKALIAKLKSEPPPSVTTDKIRKAKAAGMLTPLTGKTPEQKEKILKDLAQAGLPLPEGRTRSEKALINKIKKDFGIPKRTASEKLRKAKAAGLLTPLEGKTTDQKEKILRGRAAAGLPLPAGRTPSDRALIQKIKDDSGLVTPSPSERLRRAKAAGLLTPLKGKTPSIKEKIVKDMLAAGVPILEGETPSETEMIKKLTTEAPPLSKSRSERIKEAKAAGLLTPLKGKTPEQKENILKGLINAGLPLPEPKTDSEKDMIDKIRAQAGLPPEPKTVSLKEKIKKAQAAGLITPLEGKTPAEKKQILKALADAGIPLPEGRTASEKSLIAKVKAEIKPIKIPSEKIQKAKAAGLLTPLEGKTPEDKEKIMRGLAKYGLPLPEAKTASEKKLASKIRKELGLPPAPKTPSIKQRHERAAAAGVLVPLEGLMPAEKEKVLKAQANLGLPLPEGRTPSEKSLIAKIKAEQEPSKISSEKLRKAKAAGLLTPLEGKSPAEKEKIIRGLADAGLPLPEGKTPSEKSLIHKVRTELGIPPLAKTASEKSVIRKAKAEGLFTPITDKSPAEKERILKGLAKVGLPLPEGKTPSEKELIKKVRAEAGLPLETTPSEKMGKIKRKIKMVGSKTSKKLAKGIEAEEFIDITKTTTCDRGCGCDKKKIRFKHSYVKIRVTHPDLASLCPCPEECIPGVKAGKLITSVDKEGISVIVGRVTGVPTYQRRNSNHVIPTEMVSKMSLDLLENDFHNNTSTYNIANSNMFLNKSKINYISNTSSSDVSASNIKPHNTLSKNIYLQNSTPPYEGRTSNSDRIVKTCKGFQSMGDNYRNITSNYTSTRSSFDSILVIKSETSLSLSTSVSGSMGSISMLFVGDSSVVSSSFRDFYQTSDDVFSESSNEGQKSRKRIDYNYYIDVATRGSTDEIDNTNEGSNKQKEIVGDTSRKQDEYMVFRMSGTKINHVNYSKDETKQKPRNSKPILVVDQLINKLQLTTMVHKLLSKKEFSGASSIFIVVPTSDENDSDCSSDELSSDTSQQSIENYTKDTNNGSVESENDVKACGKGIRFYMQEIPMLSFDDKETMFVDDHINTYKHKETKNKICQIAPKKKTHSIGKGCNVISTDTTADRPCCCSLEKRNSVIAQEDKFKDQYVSSVMSRQFTPLIMKQGLNQGWFRLPSIGMHLKSPSKSSSSSRNPSPMSVSSCYMPPCSGRSCHGSHKAHKPKHVHKYPKYPQNPQACQCNPEKLRALMEQASRAGNSFDIQSIGCSGAGRKSASLQSGSKGDCITCTEPPYIDGLQCGCYDKKNTTKVRKLCPCEQHYNVSKTEPGPKNGMRSMGVITELKGSAMVAGQMDPNSSASQQGGQLLRREDSGGTSTHTGTKKTRFDVTTSKSTVNVSNRAVPKSLTNHSSPNSLENRAISQNVASHQAEDMAENGRNTTITPKSSSSKADCTCKEDKPAGKRSQVVTKGSHTKASTKKPKFFSGFRKTSQIKINCSCLEKKNSTSERQKNKQKPKNTAVTQCGCIEDEIKEEEKSGCMCNQTKPKTVSRSTSDPLLQPGLQQGLQPNRQQSHQPSRKQSLQPNFLPVYAPSVPQDVPPEPQTDLPPDLQKSIPPDLSPEPQTNVPPELQASIPPDMRPITGMPPFPCPPNMIPSGGLVEFPYEVYGPSCGWIDTGEIMRMRSEMTLTTSGFKLFQKTKNKRQIPTEKTEAARGEEIELDFEDAIRYYANMNPEKFRDLMQQEQQKPLELESEEDSSDGKKKKGKKKKKDKKKQKNKQKNKEENKDDDSDKKDKQEDSDKNNKQEDKKDGKPKKGDKDKKAGKGKKEEKDTKKGKDKKNKKAKIKGKNKGEISDEESEETDIEKAKHVHSDVTCNCPYGPIPPPISYETTETESSQESAVMTKGLKFHIGGKGSGSPGLAGIYCFDMIQESYTS